jgi:hypothetical protein
MPIESSKVVKVINALGPVLRNEPPVQAIFDVKVARAPTRVRFEFSTALPCFARVEIFRMVHGELSLDMEKANLVQTEIELFGSPKERHSILVGGLEQERRYWYRISAPRKTPGFPNLLGHVRYRGEFFTPRRNTTVTIHRIHVFDDSDTSGDGELLFRQRRRPAQSARRAATLARVRRCQRQRHPPPLRSRRPNHRPGPGRHRRLHLRL